MRCSLAITGGIVVCAVSWSWAARAEEPKAPGEPAVMREPSERFVVSDSFDEGDPFDIAIGLAYEARIARAAIGRESGDHVKRVAGFTAVTSKLLPTLEIGLYRDLALTLGFPIVLSETRELSPAGGATSGSIAAGDEALVLLPMESIERSGLEHLAFGMRATPLNQSRSADFPTWSVGAEARVAIGPTRRACTSSPAEGQVACAKPGDVDRDGQRDPGEPDLGEPATPGLARGTAGLAFSTAIGRRVRYVVPYGTVDVLVEIPLPGSLFEEASLGETLLPPVEATAGLGMAVIPWENREKFTRLDIDTRVTATYRSGGLDYSEAFDAIGASDAGSLRVLRDDSVVTGLTTVAPYGVFGLESSLVWQASAFIKLALGARVQYELSHAITDDDEGDPAYRSVISRANERLVVLDSFVGAIRVRAAVSF
ncbi:MAG: hypothetical protein JNL21_04035 [Myxococcales bacterium]|nr:hypothetical protein [Myxococcales bacterium]